MCDYIVLPEGNLYSKCAYKISARRDFASILAVNGNLLKVMIKSGEIIEINPKQECTQSSYIYADTTLSLKTIFNLFDFDPPSRTCVFNGMVYIRNKIVYTEIAARIKSIQDIDNNICITFKDGSVDEYNFVHVVDHMFLKSVTSNELILINNSSCGYGKVYCNYGEMELVPFTINNIRQVKTFDGHLFDHFPTSELSRVFRFGDLYLFDSLYRRQYYYINDGNHQFSSDAEIINKPNEYIDFTVVDNKMFHEDVHYKYNNKYYLYNDTVVLECIYKTIDYPHELAYGLSVSSINIYNGDTFIFKPMKKTIFTEIGEKIKNITFTDDPLYILNITFKNGQSIGAFMDYKYNLRFKDGQIVPMFIPGEYGQYREIPISEITARGTFSISVHNKCILFMESNISHVNTKFLEWRGNYLAIVDSRVYTGEVVISPPPLRVKAAAAVLE